MVCGNRLYVHARRVRGYYISVCETSVLTEPIGSEQREIRDALYKDGREDPTETPRHGAFDLGGTLDRIHADTAAPSSEMATRLQGVAAFRQSLSAILFISIVVRGDKAD